MAMGSSRKARRTRRVKTLAAAVASYDWNLAKATTPDAWLIHILRREAEALISKDLPASRDDK